MTDFSGVDLLRGIEWDKMSGLIPRGIMMEQDAQSLLVYARQLFPQSVLAEKLGIDARTLRRWEKGEIDMRPNIVPALREIVGANGTALVAGNDNGFDFIDLFAGIGGIRMGFEAHGGRCVFTSEWNKYAAQTYKANFDDGHEINGDITKVNEHEIPDHDVLLAGFPCQPFSIAGVSKKNSLGRAHGFMCDTQGTLFFDVARIIQAKQPAAFMLENVKNLTSHDKGRTFEVIKRTLSEELGYHIHFKVIDGKPFVPQHRERIIIVGFREPVPFSWDALNLPEEGPRMGTILHPQDGSEPAEEPYTTGTKAKVNPKYILTDKLWAYLQNYAAKHKAKGNGFGYGMVTKKDTARTLSARYYKDGSEILISRGGGHNPRRLTPRECARLMGFPDTFQIPVSDTQAYKQFGNSVVMPVMKEVARIMVPHVLAVKAGEDVRSQITLL